MGMEQDYYSRTDVREIVTKGRLDGGETSTETGDSFQFTFGDRLWTIYCTETWEDTPDDLGEIVDSAVAMTCEGRDRRMAPEVVEEEADARDQILRMVGELVMMGLSTMEALAWACTRIYDHQDALVMMERLSGRPVPDQVARNYIHRAKSKLMG